MSEIHLYFDLGRFRAPQKKSGNVPNAACKMVGTYSQIENSSRIFKLNGDRFIQVLYPKTMLSEKYVAAGGMDLAWKDKSARARVRLHDTYVIWPWK